MATVDDQATEKEEFDREIAIKYHRRDTGPAACGLCYYCSSPVRPGDRWCDEDCRDDWQKDEWARKQAPR